ncbi:MAG TPA: class II aldolase/adducin family protein [Thermodesulfobacteriota bacterium]|nr:class II aldolase/adducin family protein [Deltaproteobacteria bacterium]HNR12102.1 class II aldolase/adducin family protein [Thermodesulfobacteriota bacterium]HNU72459.1 class II aldolase/adducin family protein [Thermodesulfobacteriota bacterium]HOC38972.1 class II aldolase/adducin family protein [Thermodesulfobacteriota bacterium]
MYTIADEKTRIQELITIAHRSYDRCLTAGCGGNISVRLDDNRFLISRSGSSLGFLAEDDIVSMSCSGEKISGTGKPSSEAPVHAAIYRALRPGAILHTHPPVISALAISGTPFRPIIFEHSVVLGDVPVIPQQSPNIINSDELIEPLKNNKVLILQHHGVITIGDTLLDAFLLNDLLEASAKTIVSAGDIGRMTPLPDISSKRGRKLPEGVEFFSAQHARFARESANSDRELASLGKSSGFSTDMRLRLNDDAQDWLLALREGKIEEIVFNDRKRVSVFTFSATKEVWERVFRGKIPFFVAIYQGRMTMEGDGRKLSEWYSACRLLFECLKIK